MTLCGLLLIILPLNGVLVQGQQYHNSFGLPTKITNINILFLFWPIQTKCILPKFFWFLFHFYRKTLKLGHTVPTAITFRSTSILLIVNRRKQWRSWYDILLVVNPDVKPAWRICPRCSQCLDAARTHPGTVFGLYTNCLLSILKMVIATLIFVQLMPAKKLRRVLTLNWPTSVSLLWN